MVNINLLINIPHIHSKEVLTKATDNNKEKVDVKAANSIYPHPTPVLHSCLNNFVADSRFANGS